MNTVRHGDVPLHRIDSLPKGAEKVEHDLSFTLAYGEVTGHHHTLYPAKKEDMEIYKMGSTYIVNLKVDVPLRHQEHKELIVPAGIWTVGMEEEYCPFMKRMNKVVD
jgi:hypothetical protein